MTQNDSFSRTANLVGLLAGSFTVALGLTVLVGWFFEVPLLKGVFSGLVTMKANTAVGFTLTGVALLLLRQERTSIGRRRVGQVCAGVIVLVGLLTLSQYVVGWELGIDQLLFAEEVGTIGTSSPGRMSPITALNFALLGAALVLLDTETRRGRRPAQLLVVVVVLCTMPALTGYLYGTLTLTGFAASTKMAVHTAVGFLVVSVGALLARPRRGLMAIVTYESVGGFMARRLIPPALVVPIVLGWLRLAGEWAGFYDAEFGVSLTVMAMIAVFSTLVWFNSVSLHRMDLVRRKSEEEVIRAHDMLEVRVAERTADLHRVNARLHTEVAERSRAEEKLKEHTNTLAAMNQKLERINDELVRRNTELDEFTYVASHDLQEPLRKLVSFGQLLPKDLGGDLPPRAGKDLAFITDAARRMQTLVVDLLALSRAGRADLKRERLSLDDCVDRAVQALATRVVETHAEINRDALPDVVGDPTLLTQLYQNLLGNALKFVSVGRTPLVHVTAEHDNGRWIFGVRDNGIGIKPQYHEQIFAPFKRLQGRDEYEGTGIGLAIARKAVERHGGRIWVESEPARGAHFKFTLQVDAEVAEWEPEKVSQPSCC